MDQDINGNNTVYNLNSLFRKFLLYNFVGLLILIVSAIFIIIFLNNYQLNKRLIQKESYDPDINDCVNLYNTIIKTKRLCVLEFGSGWSTLVIAKALYDLKKKYFKKVRKIRKH